MKHLILFSLFLALFTESHSQTMWMDDNHNLFINQVLPIYLKISTNLENPNDKILAEKKDEPNNTQLKLVYFSREGKNRIKTKTYPTKLSIDDSSVKDYEFVVFVDGSAPTTEISYEGAGIFKKNNKIFLGPKAMVNLKGEDRYSPLEGVYYSINNETFSSYTHPFHLSKEGMNIISYYGVDRVGNVESPRTDSVIADFSAPVCKINFSPSHEIKESNNKKEKNETLIFGKQLTIELELHDAGSGINRVEYSLNKNEFIPYTGKIKLNATTKEQEIYNLLVHFNDQLGNYGVTEINFILNPELP